MQRPHDLVADQYRDQPLDLPPAREMLHIALLAAYPRPRCRLDIRRHAEARDQISGALIDIAIGHLHHRPIEVFEHARPALVFLPQEHDARIMPHTATAIPLGLYDQLLISHSRTGTHVPKRNNWYSAARFGMRAPMNTQPPPARQAGGFLIAASTLIGTGIGVALGQPSIGVLAGTGFGSGLALLVWLKDRKG